MNYKKISLILLITTIILSLFLIIPIKDLILDSKINKLNLEINKTEKEKIIAIENFKNLEINYLKSKDSIKVLKNISKFKYDSLILKNKEINNKYLLIKQKVNANIKKTTNVNSNVISDSIERLYQSSKR